MPMIEFQPCFQAVFRRCDRAVATSRLSIAKGELVFLAGPSGAGKSTLLKMIAAIERPSAGTVTGQRPGHRQAQAVRLALSAPQARADLPAAAPADRPQRAGQRHAAAAGDRRRREPMPSSAPAPRWTRSACWTRPHAAPLTLSGGEQQRVAIARAIVQPPADHPGRRTDRQPRPRQRQPR